MTDWDCHQHDRIGTQTTFRSGATVNTFSQDENEGLAEDVAALQHEYEVATGTAELLGRTLAEAHSKILGLEEQLEAAQEAVRLRDESDDYRVLRLERLLAQHGIDLPPGFRTAPTQSGASAEGDEAGLGSGDAGDAGAAHLADSPASFPAREFISDSPETSETSIPASEPQDDDAS